MILAEKIMDQRKKNGWSQEELAEKMNVSRQAVSKWESAQSVPELEKVLKLSQLFGVSTDYLLKDELDTLDADQTVEELPVVRRVSMEEANAFLDIKEKTAGQIAFATFLCIISPVCLLFLGGASEAGVLSISENFAGGMGLVIMLLLVVAAAAIYISCGGKTSIYEYLEKEVFETEYGVSGMVKERQAQYRDTYTKGNIIGTCLCIIGAIPLFISSIFDAEMGYVVSVCLLLLFVAVGVVFFIRVGIRWTSMQKLLQEGDYTRAKKKRSPIAGTVATVYWLVVVAIYLGWSFSNDSWKESWIILVVAGVLYGAVAAVVNVAVKNKQDN